MGLRWVIKSYLLELKVNSGLSMKDAINRIDERSLRLEQRVDELFVMMSRRQ
jgi:division protein CdvB (Snf7/Vps24/ESCRT-III family)